MEALAREHDLLPAGRLTGLVLQDASGAVVSANRAAEDFLGLSFAQMQGRQIPDGWRDVIDVDGEFLPPDWFPTMVTLRTGEPAHRVIGSHRPRIERPGEHVWLEVSTTSLSVLEHEAPLVSRVTGS